VVYRLIAKIVMRPLIKQRGLALYDASKIICPLECDDAYPRAMLSTLVVAPVATQHFPALHSKQGLGVV
jgi:hypothetical protein